MGWLGRIIGGPLGDAIEDQLSGDTPEKKGKRRSRNKWLKPPIPTDGPVDIRELPEDNDTSDRLVKPIPGSVLKCDLVLGAACHTGIYLGNDRIVEVTEIDGRARVRAVSPDEVLNGDPDSLVRTGVTIYVAASGGKALGSAVIARRARASLNRSRGKYKLLENNCHMFTRYCITGTDSDESVLTEEEIEEILCDTFGVDSVTWCSTGLGYGDYSFDGIDYEEEVEEDEDEDEEEDEDWDVESEDDDGYVVVGSLSDMLKSSARSSRKTSIRQLLGEKTTVCKKSSKRAPAKKRSALKAAPTKCVVPKTKRRAFSKALSAKKAKPTKKVAPAKRAVPTAKKRRHRGWDMGL